MEQIDIAIIGAGPAGLMAAIAAAERLSTADVADSKTLEPVRGLGGPIGAGRIVVFEKGPRPGRKLLASGSGRCNLTHAGPIAAFLGHYGGGEQPPGPPREDGTRAPGSAGRFLRRALYEFDNEGLRQWMAQRGLDTKADDNGKVFPVSDRAADVLSVLLRQAEAAGVRIWCSCAVDGLSPAELTRNESGLSGQGFSLLSGSRAWQARVLVVAAGGHSYPALGSAGDSWRLAAGLGHSLADPGPALAPVYVEPWRYKSCAGISLRVSSLTIRRSGRVVARGSGDVLFTHGGLSGPGILDCSRWIRPGDELLVPLGPFSGVDTADDALRAACAANPGKQLRGLLAELIPKRLAEVLLGLAGCPGDTRAAQLSKAHRQRLAAGLGGEVFLVERLGGLDEAMASRGGVTLAELDPKTLMSRLIPGLFFAGEALDLDGDTGGYNIQAAFSSGRLAGLSAADHLVSGLL